VEGVLNTAMTRIEFGELRSLLAELQQHSDEQISEMAVLYSLVLAVLDPAPKRRGDRASEKKQALMRVPRELRKTVLERVEAIRRRRKAKDGDS
jgi:hypothetical protein